MKDAERQISRLIEVGRHAEADRLLASELAEHPTDPDLHWLAARAALGAEDDVRAREHLEQALASDPHHFRARFLAFAIAFDAERFAEAEEIVTGLIREHPADAELIAWYAHLMLRTLHVAKARALVDEALARDPDEPVARRVDVLLLTIEGRSEHAGRRLEELIRDDPEGLATARTLFLVLAERGRHREAFEVGRQLLRADPANPALIDALVELRAATHWSALPAYPMRRFGWLGVAAVWGVGVVGVRAAASWSPAWSVTFLVLYLAYVVYAWVHPPWLKRWLRRRGF
ncbi:MAG: tetratricopeptide repeat protein [Myxococcota bacterium]